ncbi:MAG: hypothetical protein ACTHK3_07150, partial [Solirubrobacterales bacterium]
WAGGSALLVLGYAEATDANSPAIRVPPFHTGHLGFVPDTPVCVGLVQGPLGAPHREVVVTPFKKDPRDLVLVTVAMRDQAGVVARLMGAVAALGFNIEVLESSSIKQLHNHSVTLLVQLSAPPGGISSNDETPTAVRRLYQGYDSVLPVENLACVCLFESIVAHCADVLEWRQPFSLGPRLPEIEIRGYPDVRTLSDFVLQPLKTAGDGKLHAQIDLPNEIANGLQPVVSADGKLEYLLVSDTTARSLHAFFMQPALARRVFHVGFYHDDVPGALATILALLREAEFNILTSLVRKQGEGRSVWEAVLQYQGDAEVPNGNRRHAHDPIREKEVKWICERIVAAHEQNSEEVVKCSIDVAPPKYPARKSKRDVQPVSLSTLLKPSIRSSGQVSRYEPAELLKERLAKLEEGDRGDPYGEAAKALVRLIQRRHVEGADRPTVFLSYPSSASSQGDLVWKQMDGGWRMDRYQKPDGEAILERVIAKIEACDYFIGIWHPEKAVKRRTKKISPWMLFEYGVAHAAGKPAIIVRSDMLHKDIWQRITPGVASPEYSEDNFGETVSLIVDYAEQHFV